MKYLKGTKIKKTRVVWPIPILYDDREKKGRWHIDHPKFEFKKKRLEVADYTIEGFEDIVAVERKANFAEVISNITGKKKRRFEKFLAKLSLMPIPIFVIEENIGKLPLVFKNLKYSGLKPENIYDLLGIITVDLGIRMIFLDGTRSSKEVFLYYLFSHLHERALRLR